MGCRASLKDDQWLSPNQHSSLGSLFDKNYSGRLKEPEGSLLRDLRREYLIRSWHKNLVALA